MSEDSNSQILDSEKTQQEKKPSKLRLVVMELIRLSIFATLVVLSLKLIGNKTAGGVLINYSDSFYSQNIRLNANIRGVFPILSGSSSDLYGKWKIGLVRTVDQSATSNNFTLSFYDKKLELQNSYCKMQVTYNWNSYIYNMHVTKKKVQKITLQNTTNKTNSSAVAKAQKAATEGKQIDDNIIQNDENQSEQKGNLRKGQEELSNSNSTDEDVITEDSRQNKTENSQKQQGTGNQNEQNIQNQNNERKLNEKESQNNETNQNKKQNTGNQDNNPIQDQNKEIQDENYKGTQNQNNDKENINLTINNKKTYADNQTEYSGENSTVGTNKNNVTTEFGIDSDNTTSQQNTNNATTKISNNNSHQSNGNNLEEIKTRQPTKEELEKQRICQGYMSMYDSYLKKFSIWTLFNGDLYILSEPGQNVTLCILQKLSQVSS